MKNVLTILFSLFTLVSNGQDYCREVKKEVANLTTFTYSSPFDSTKIPSVKINRSYSIDSDLAFDNFVITLQIVSELQPFYVKNPHGDGENDPKKLTIDFEDKTRISDTSISISYEINNEDQTVTRSVFINLDESNLKSFANKKMSGFAFGGVQKILNPDTANAYLGYIKCMHNAKK